jgi:hypothetical protein
MARPSYQPVRARRRSSRAAAGGDKAGPDACSVVSDTNALATASSPAHG